MPSDPNNTDNENVLPVKKRRSYKKKISLETEVIQEPKKSTSLDNFVVTPKPVDPKEEILKFSAANKFVARFPVGSAFCIIQNTELENFVLIFHDESKDKWVAKSTLNTGAKNRTRDSISTLSEVLEWTREQCLTEFVKNRKNRILREESVRKNRQKFVKNA